MEDLISTYSNHDEKLRIMVKYEDLRKNTVEELLKIYKFLEIDISRNKLEEIVDKTIIAFEKDYQDLRERHPFHLKSLFEDDSIRYLQSLDSLKRRFIRKLKRRFL